MTAQDDTISRNLTDRVRRLELATARTKPAGGITVTDSGGFFGGGALTLEEIIAAIGAGTLPNSFLRTTLGGVGVVQALGTLGATETIDLANGNLFWGTLDQACTITTTGWTNLKDCQITVILFEDGTGGWTPTFSGVTWDGGTPTHDTTAGTFTRYVFTSIDGGTTIIGVQTGSGSSGTGGRPPWDYVIAADDTAADLQAIADAVCDGTADQTEINTAITAAVAASRSYSILLLPGTYFLSGAIDFTPMVGMVLGDWVTFEASATTIRAAANIAKMIALDPGAGDQIVTSLDLRLGMLDGNGGTNTVTNIVRMARFSDNRVRINDLYNGTGNGILVDQDGVADFPCGNNQLEINTLRNNDGAGFYVTGDTSPYGFQGNIVRFGQVIANGHGFIIGENTNDNAIDNTFIGSPIEHNTGYGIYDRCGKNIWIVNNTNSNTTAGLGGPTGMDFKSTYIGTFEDTIEAAVTDQHYILNAGVNGGLNEYAERTSPAATPDTGFGRFWLEDDGKWYGINSAGTVVEFGAPTGHYELLMVGSGPPEPLENGAGDDWLYVFVPA